MNDPVRFVQLSDTHFLEQGREPEGGFAYDTAAAFDAVAAAVDWAEVDHLVVTGDIADHGEAAQYEVALAALAEPGVPVHCVPGNHDQDEAFTAGLDRDLVTRTRMLELGEWCHLFVDSNSVDSNSVDSNSADSNSVDSNSVDSNSADSNSVDSVDYHERLSGNGMLGEAESAWVRDRAAAAEADHLFIWVHHPPMPPIGLCDDDAYAAQWQALLPELDRLRGVSGGHTHVPGDYELDGVPVAMAPSLKNNFDLDARTLLPPGWRSWTFHPDGAVETALHFVDDPRWPRSPMGRAVCSLLTGELSFTEFNAIVERKRAV